MQPTVPVPGAVGLKRLEIPLFGLFFACWLLAAAHGLGIVSLAGTLTLGLYPLNAVAAAVGWLSGNVYVWRRRHLTREQRRRASALWLVGPQGIPALLRAMAPAADQVAAPAVPLYAFAVGAVLFTVPLLFSPK